MNKSSEEEMKIANKIDEIVYITDLKEEYRNIERNIVKGESLSKCIKFLNVYRKTIMSKPKRYYYDRKNNTARPIDGVHREREFINVADLGDEERNVLKEFELIREANIYSVESINVTPDEKTTEEKPKVETKTIIRQVDLDELLGDKLKLPKKMQDKIAKAISGDIYAIKDDGEYKELKPVLFHKGSLVNLKHDLETKGYSLCYDIGSIDKLPGDFKELFKDIVIQLDKVEGNKYTVSDLNKNKTI